MRLARLSKRLRRIVSLPGGDEVVVEIVPSSLRDGGAPIVVVRGKRCRKPHAWLVVRGRRPLVLEQLKLGNV